jgi:hypothetical protein
MVMRKQNKKPERRRIVQEQKIAQLVFSSDKGRQTNTDNHADKVGRDPQRKR